MSSLLIFGPSWVGDMVLAQSLFKTLKLNNPDCQIDVAAPTWTLPLLDRMPEVREAIPLPFRHGELALAARYRLGRSLRGRGYQRSVILTNSFKSAIPAFAAGIPLRSGYLGEMRYGLLNDIHLLDKRLLPQTVQRFVALAGLRTDQPRSQGALMIPQPALQIDPLQVIQAMQQHRIPDISGQKVLGLCPGAEYGEAKRWPAEYYAEVANHALSQGWQVWLFGSGKESEITGQINQLSQQRCLDLGGKTSLGEAIDLMSLTDQIVCNDSGLMHVAAALGKSMVAVFGSSDPRHTPPISAQATILKLDMACSPCFQRTCPLGHLRCLKEIKPEMVLAALQQAKP